MSEINVPLEVAAGLCAMFCAMGVWAGWRRAHRKLETDRNPLEGLMQPAALGEAIDLAARRNAVRGISHAVLYGQIDQLAGMRGVWSPDVREQVRSHVTAVMRAGLRREDRFNEVAGEGFTIVIPGADERAAVRIADRLRRALARLRIPHFSSDGWLTASFGVAADQTGDTGDLLSQRALQALRAAIAQGQDHVIAASDVDEVLLLPAPQAPQAASAA